MAKIFRLSPFMKRYQNLVRPVVMLLEMDLVLKLQIVPCPVIGSGDWGCLVLTIMGTESYFWIIVTLSSNKPSTQDGS